MPKTTVPKKFVPTLEPSAQAHKLTVPYTAEGQAFIQQLQDLLGGKPLPFVKICPRDQTIHLAAEADGGDSANLVAPSTTKKGKTATGNTTYSLDISIDTEGWPP